MRVVIADPSPLLRDVLAGVFTGTADIDVAATAATLDEIRTGCRRFTPEVVISGTSFPDGDMSEAIAGILLTGTRVLVVCDASSANVSSALLFAGASGCLFVQDAGPIEVVDATRDVAAGNAALHPAVAAAVLRQWRAEQVRPGGSRDSAPTTTPRVRLTPREGEVLAALARGLPTKLIGRELVVSPKTVEAHIARLLAKLGARNRAHAVSVALECGLLESGAVKTPG
ncbi:MAG: response regulator transcription factor [Pseudonocardia sp.]